MRTWKPHLKLLFSVTLVQNKPLLKKTEVCFLFKRQLEMAGLNLQLKKEKKSNKTSKQALPGCIGSALDFSGANGVDLGN